MIFLIKNREEMEFLGVGFILFCLLLKIGLGDSFEED